MNKSGKKSFLENVRKIWGDRYDYADVVYINAKTKVTVICALHGPWLTTPSNHTGKRARGCPECGGSKRKTFDQFVTEAQRKHGLKYTYPIQEYKNALKKVRIVCEQHQEFMQTPDAHLRGHGCPNCADKATGERSRFTEEEVNARLVSFCNERLPKVTLQAGSYKGMNKEGKIICEIHGLQKARLMTSIFASPHPCLECSRNYKVRKYTTNEFREIIKARFNEKYKILDFEYENKKTEIKFECGVSDHGVFSLQAASVYTSPGCPKCASSNSEASRIRGLRLKAEQTRVEREQKWLNKATLRHSNFYDYSNVVYISQNKPVLIGCPIHGIRSQTPYNHLQGGCRLCADMDLKGLFSSRFFEKNPDEKNRDATLYYVKFKSSNELFFKVGVTTTSVATRFSVVPKNIFEIEILNINDTLLYEAWRLEEQIQSTHGAKFRYRPIIDGINPRQFRLGASECFSVPLSVEDERRYFPE